MFVSPPCARTSFRLVAAIVVAAMLSGTDVAAQTGNRTRVGIGLAPAAFIESWNDNGSTEWLAAGLLGVLYRFADRWSLNVETNLTYVGQANVRGAFIVGVSPLLRFAVTRPGRTTVFVELGPGWSWSDSAVPERGTRFNYMAQAGGGVLFGGGPNVQFVASARWVHFSNNGREGRARNPDIEAIGGYSGVVIWF
jgi:hypothetical protein